MSGSMQHRFAFRCGLFALLAAGILMAGSPSALAGSNCDLERGVAVLDQCKVCHSVGDGEAHSTGPNLFGIVGRDAASQSGFAYSKVLRNSGFVWDLDTLDNFLANPQDVLPYNRMAFGGVTDEEDRAAVICALEDLR